MSPLILVMLIILLVGVICLVAAIRSSLRERSFRKYAQLRDAVITGYAVDAEERYLTLYKFEIDGREVHGVLPDSIPEPIMRVGEMIPLFVRPDDPTKVLPVVSQTQATIRTFNYLIGGLMVITAIPLLVLLA